MGTRMHDCRRLIACAWLLLCLGAAGTALAQDDDFLEPDDAFAISGRLDGPDTLVVGWDIADGYYMYRSKFQFDSQTGGVALGTPSLPEAEIKHDEFFGDVGIYRGHVEARIPLERTAAAGTSLVVETRSQGCADAGLCYPPHGQHVALDLPPAPVQSPAGASDGLASLGLDLGFGGENEILDVEDAFQVDARVTAPDRLTLDWEIAPGTFIYRDMIVMSIDNADIAIGDYSLPAATIKPNTVQPDGEIGEVAIYDAPFTLDLPLARSESDATDARLEVRYQGCADVGICYPPVTERLSLALPAFAGGSSRPMLAKASVATAGAGSIGPEFGTSEQDRIAAFLAEGALFAILAFYGFGLLLAFTPCVFPMIPILSGIIVGQGATLTTRRAFVLSLVYVLAMALSYALVGVLAGLGGANLQATFQNPWIIALFAAVFVALSLSMFGFYDLQLPSSLQTKLSELSNKQEGGSLIGVGIMGVLSALIVGPCVAPPLAGALIFIGQSGDALLGFAALFALGLGMGTPLIVIGTSAGKLLPRAGAWMDAVKAVFGVALLGVAIFLLERVIPAPIAMALWAVLLICSAIYMGALVHLPDDAGGWRKLFKGLGTVLLVYGVLMLAGAAAGSKDTLQPLRGLVSTTGAMATEHPRFERIKTVDDLDRALAAAAAAGRAVMLDFYADWCVSCKEMERYTFTDPTVIREMERFDLLQADVTANDAEDQALLRGRFGLVGPPAILFFDGNGDELRNRRLVGFKPADAFAAHLAGIAP